MELLVGVPAISAERWKNFHVVYANADFFLIVLNFVWHASRVGDISI
jgi:hypothetical protein